MFIQNISKVISGSGSKTGNNRKIQPFNQRKLYYYKKKNDVNDIFESLELLSPSIDDSTNSNNSNGKKRTTLVDKILSNGNKDLDNMLKANNLS